MSVNSQEYYRVVEECALTGRNFPISNGMPEHAVYLMTLMLRHAKKNIRLLTEELPNEVGGADSEKTSMYADSSLINAAEKFLKNAEAKLDILLQTGIDLKSRTLIKVLKEKKERQEILGTINIHLAKGKAISLENHFMVMDSTAYRVETDHGHTKAVANFGDHETAKKLVDFFDNVLWPDSLLVEVI